MTWQRHHDPGTLAVITLATTAAAAGTSAYGAHQAGQAGKAAYTYQAQVAKNNKVIADRNAEYALATGETEAQMKGMKTAQDLGNAKTIQAASGLDVNSGSPLEVREQIASMGSFDEMMIRSNAQRKSYAAKVEGTNQQAQADISTMAGRQAETAGTIGSFSSLLGGASSVSDKWMKFKAAGIEGF